MSDTKSVHLAGSVLGRHRHVGAFFHDRDEEYRVLMPFIREGFEQGDRALHIIDPRNREDHLRRLEEAGIDVAKSEGEQQLEIRPWADAHLRYGHFDQHRQIALIESLLIRGSEGRFPITRLVASMEWALEDKPGVNDIVEYESRVNDTLCKYDDAVCCTYNLARFSASVVMDALRVHPMVIVGGLLQENPFYVPPDVFIRELRERGRRGRPSPN